MAAPLTNGAASAVTVAAAAAAHPHQHSHSNPDLDSDSHSNSLSHSHMFPLTPSPYAVAVPTAPTPTAAAAAAAASSSSSSSYSYSSSAAASTTPTPTAAAATANRHTKGLSLPRPNHLLDTSPSPSIDPAAIAIHNHRKKTLAQELSGRTPVAAIIEKLEVRTQQEIEEQQRLELLQQERERLAELTTLRLYTSSTTPTTPTTPTLHTAVSSTAESTDATSRLPFPPELGLDLHHNRDLNLDLDLGSSLSLSLDQTPNPLNMADTTGTATGIRRSIAAANATATTDKSTVNNSTTSTPAAGPVSYSTAANSSINFTDPFNAAASSPSPPVSESASIIEQLQTQIHGLAAAAASASPSQSASFHPPPPLLRTISDNGDLPIRHPVPDIPPRSTTSRDNIAQLEATAVRLSMTSSIDDAIRDLHSELKRSDSRRSSVLAANLREREREEEIRALPPLSRHLSNASSIVSVNHVARYGGYSPGEYTVASPTSSITSRLRAKSDAEPPVSLNSLSGGGLTRSGPGKGSVRSIHSRSLAGISETDRIPDITTTTTTTTTTSKMESLSEQPGSTENNTATAHVHQGSNGSHSVRLPSFDTRASESLSLGVGAGSSTATATASGHGQQASYSAAASAAPANRQRSGTAQSRYSVNPPPPAQQQTSASRRASVASATESDQAKDMFGDFDGVHCVPDLDDDLSTGNMGTMGQNMGQQPPSMGGPLAGFGTDANTLDTQLQFEQQQHPQSQQQMHQRQSMMPAGAARPKSYMDPATGMEMNFYPARVPMMLNLPQKLSKKPKAAQRNARQSKVLSMMPNINKDTTPWLNNPTRLETYEPEPIVPEPMDFLPNPVGGLGEDAYKRQSFAADVLGEDVQLDSPSQAQQPFAAGQSHEQSVYDKPAGAGGDDTRRASIDYLSQGFPDDGPIPAAVPRRKNGDKRQSHLPPQLRATVFFEMPSVTTNIKIQEGSATNTLEDLLEASATAPVSAFTDHLIANKLGVESYGANARRSIAPVMEKRQSKMPAGKALQTSASVDGLRKPNKLRKRSSQLSIDALTDGGLDVDVDPETEDIARVRRASRRLDLDVSDAGSRLSGDANRLGGGGDDDENMETIPLADDDETKQEEGDEDMMFHGAPTTLLAELQLRKQQQKLRTRNHFPNGMHSTLLEMDAVAERQRQNRTKIKVNLAWEEGAEASGDEESDEDVPLGLLYATKAAGTKNLNVAVAEMHRPLGLMEKREMEDNEPLSSRRARIMGDSHVPLPKHGAMYGPMHGAAMHGAAADVESEEEDEPLAARRARLKGEDAGALPAARPVSGAFSTELLTQFVVEPAAAEAEARKKEEEEEEARKQREGTGAEAEEEGEGLKSKTPAIEAEETLGQRRRRLQAEREAAAAADAAAVAHGSKLTNMAGLLSANPVANASRFYAGPSNGSHGGAGFKNGVYNTGQALGGGGGGGGIRVVRGSSSQMNLRQPTQQHHHQGRPSYGGNGAYGGVYGNHGNNMAMSASMGQLPVYGQQQQQQQQQQGGFTGYGMPLHNQVDRVERWRQSVMQ